MLDQINNHYNDTKLCNILKESISFSNVELNNDNNINNISNIDCQKLLINLKELKNMIIKKNNIFKNLKEINQFKPSFDIQSNNLLNYNSLLLTMNTLKLKSKLDNKISSKFIDKSKYKLKDRNYYKCILTKIKKQDDKIIIVNKKIKKNNKNNKNKYWSSGKIDYLNNYFEIKSIKWNKKIIEMLSSKLNLSNDFIIKFNNDKLKIN